MSEELIVILITIVNLSLFFVHTRLYKEPRNRLRQIWAYLTNVIALGIIYFHLPNWIYSGFLRDYSPLFLVYAVCVGSLIMLCLNRNIKKKGNIFVIQILLYFAIFIGLREQYINLHKYIPLYAYWGITAFMIGILHFIIDGVVSKKGKSAIIPSIQITLFFSAYSVLFWGSYGFGFSILDAFPDHLTTLKLLGVISILAMLPEILGILGLVWLSKKKKLLGIIFVLVALIAYAEIYPLRITFIHGGIEDVMRRLSDQEHLKPFGQLDRKFEFMRSLGIIESLKNHSKNTSAENLRRVVLDMPNFRTYPEILSLEWKWEQHMIDNIDQFHKAETLMLNMELDSDGDGLSDFMEAKLLCDAYRNDTDGDGYTDSEDSDPLNPLIDSEIAQINAVILKSILSFVDEYSYVRDTQPFCVVSNSFWDGRGEIANFGKHVILLKNWQEDLWSAIFKDHLDFWDEGFINIRFGRRSFDLSGRIVVVDVTHSWGGVYMTLLVKWNGKWHHITFR